MSAVGTSSSTRAPTPMSNRMVGPEAPSAVCIAL